MGADDTEGLTPTEGGAVKQEQIDRVVKWASVLVLEHSAIQSDEASHENTIALHVAAAITGRIHAECMGPIPINVIHLLAAQTQAVVKEALEGQAHVDGLTGGKVIPGFGPPEPKKDGEG
jgi:hypothetical protein